MNTHGDDVDQKFADNKSLKVSDGSESGLLDVLDMDSYDCHDVDDGVLDCIGVYLNGDLALGNFYCSYI